MDHTRYDKRRYPIVDVAEGYGEWAATYEQTVQDEMDLRLLERLQRCDWRTPRRVLDLACGTGRIGTWLRARSDAEIHGVDITPQMLARARERGVYAGLTVRDIARTGARDAEFDLCLMSLADEHLADLRPLYAEAARVTRPRGHFVLVGFHPYFLMSGMPTHFDRASGEPLTIRSYVHLFADHVSAALAHGWTLCEMTEGLVDDDWLRKKPKWEKHLGIPVSFAMVWRRDH